MYENDAAGGKSKCERSAETVYLFLSFWSERNRIKYTKMNKLHSKEKCEIVQNGCKVNKLDETCIAEGKDVEKEGYFSETVQIHV